MQSEADAVIAEARALEREHGGRPEPAEEPSLKDLLIALGTARDLSQALISAKSLPEQEEVLDETLRTTGALIAKLEAAG